MEGPPDLINGRTYAQRISPRDVHLAQLVLRAGQKYLNPAYWTIPINGNCRILGVVREVRLKL